MTTLSIAVVSDIHVGAKARAKDLCPDENPKAIDTDYLPRFKEFAHRRSVRSDYLAIPGDLSNTAHPNEFAHAAGVIRNLASSLNVGKRKVLFVPGNHDVDWEVLKIGPRDRTGLRRRQRYDPIRQVPEIVSWMGNRLSVALDEPYCAVWDFPTLTVVGFNSAWHDNPDIGIHFGSLHERAMETAEEKLATLGPMDGKVRVLLVHHHPIQYKDPVAGEPDFSIMQDADAVLRFASKHRFDLLIHGHRHSPNVSVRTLDGGHPLVVLGAGSFSAQLDTKWSGLVSNGFHVVRIDSRDPQTGVIRGHVESWAFLCGNGWRESERPNGLAHRWAFGTYWLGEELRRRLREAAGAALHGRGYADWGEIVGRVPEVAYVLDERIDEALTAVAADVGCRKFGSGRESVVLVRGV